MTSPGPPAWRPRPALVATTGAAAWSAAHQGLVPPVLLVAVIVAGATVSWRRGGSAGRRRPAAALPMAAVVVAVAVALIAGRGIDLPGEPHRALGLLAGAAAVAVALLSFDWTSGDRVRCSLAVSLVAQAGATAELPLAGGALRLLGWAALATTALVLLDGEAMATTPPLSAGGPAGQAAARRAWRHPAMDAAAIVVLVALVTAVGSQLDLSPPRATAEPGATPGRLTAAPYLGSRDELDTALRGEPGDDVVLRVDAAAPDFWRGQTFDAWDGRVWRRSLTKPLDPRFTYPARNLISPAFGNDLQDERFVQRFELLAPGSDLVFGAYSIVEVELASGIAVPDLDGSVRTLEPLGRGATYNVVSHRPRVNAEALRAHDPLEVELPPEMAGLDVYLELPEVPDRVVALAHEVTASAPTTYDKIRALEAWMGANTTYTRDIPPLPPGADAVEQHLFVDRRGFCEQIGTSLVVMLRTLGVPARLTVGFTPGDQSVLGGEFTVRADDAHAWAEVYFPGLGWQGFDPTADVPLSDDYEQSFLASLPKLLRRLGPVAVAVVAAAAVAVLVLAGRAGLAWWRRRQARPWVTVFFPRLVRAGGQRGRPRWRHETPAEYLAALSTSVLPDPRLPDVGGVAPSAEWSGRALPAPARAGAEAVLAEATRRWPVSRPWHRRRRGPSVGAAPAQEPHP
ncbi:MAG: transglutaminaseTgpA domain-containing protein [Acidimicrobiales bacterium]